MVKNMSTETALSLATKADSSDATNGIVPSIKDVKDMVSIYLFAF